MSNAIALSRRAFYRIWQSRFVRNVTVVASGTTGAQAITVAFAPLITRIYGPEAFGLLGTFMAIVAVAVPVSALAYPIAIVLPREDCDAVGLVRLSAILSFGVAALAAALLAFGGDWLAASIGAVSVAGYLFLIPLAMVFAAWLHIAQYWLIRKKQFSVVARSAIAHSLILNSAKSGIGWLHPVGAVLIVLATLGHALHAAFLFIGCRRRFPAESSEVEERALKPLKELAHQYRDFPLYRAPQNFINAASQSMPVLMLAAFFGPSAAGFYTLAKMVMGMPSTLIAKAVQDVFYRYITDAANDSEDLPRQILRATGALLVISIAPFGLVIAFGPWFFGLVFGMDWVLAGEYARWLAVFYLFNFINKPAVAAVPVLGIQRGLLGYELFSTVAKALGLVLGFYWFGSDFWAVALFSIVGALSYGAMIVWILSCARKWRSNAKTS